MAPMQQSVPKNILLQGSKMLYIYPAPAFRARRIDFSAIFVLISLPCPDISGSQGRFLSYVCLDFSTLPQRFGLTG